MNDDQPSAELDQADASTEAAAGEATDGGILDEYDDAVLAADDTGMLSAERLITTTEIEQGLEGDV